MQIQSIQMAPGRIGYLDGS